MPGGCWLSVAVFPIHCCRSAFCSARLWEVAPDARQLLAVAIIQCGF